MRVLIIEDNDDSAETLRALISMAGHKVEVAADGRTGIERAEAFKPTLVFCDIGLPDGFGFAVAESLRRVCGKSTFLVALTGYGEEEDRRRAAAAGFDLHLTKPVDVDQFENLLSQVAARP